ncbi:hypothetical protein AVEN_175610-1 [Araneus ventricosus]|uniref:Uncharacterized protein n=1 Tax=Araneus ventricosus TaxID=182803 RepID=A0A4Y2G0T2_ARAVE|nr:hypothetical protein AVEN_175610-1 [Araneus ventricosus]
MVVEAFVPSVNQSIETDKEEIKAEMTTCQVLLQRSEDMKITWCEIQPVVDKLCRSDQGSSRVSVLPSSNSLHQNHTCFRDIALDPKTSTT